MLTTTSRALLQTSNPFTTSSVTPLISTQSFNPKTREALVKTYPAIYSTFVYTPFRDPDIVLMFRQTLPNCMLYDNYHFYESFRTEHEQRYGKPPYVERGVQFEWFVSVKQCPLGTFSSYHSVLTRHLILKGKRARKSPRKPVRKQGSGSCFSGTGLKAT